MDTKGNFILPKSPFTEKETEDMKRLKAMLPEIEQYIKDAKAIGTDTSEAERVFNEGKAQLEALVKVYGDKYKT